MGARLLLMVSEVPYTHKSSAGLSGILGDTSLLQMLSCISMHDVCERQKGLKQPL